MRDKRRERILAKIEGRKGPIPPPKPDESIAARLQDDAEFREKFIEESKAHRRQQLNQRVPRSGLAAMIVALTYGTEQEAARA